MFEGMSAPRDRERWQQPPLRGPAECRKDLESIHSKIHSIKVCYPFNHSCLHHLDVTVGTSTDRDRDHDDGNDRTLRRWHGVTLRDVVMKVVVKGTDAVGGVLTDVHLC